MSFNIADFVSGEGEIQGHFVRARSGGMRIDSRGASCAISIVMGLLSTHILDTMRGRPALGVVLELYAIAADGARTLITQTETNADGRTNAALLEGASFRPGCYEIVFHLGDYFRRQGGPVAEPPFFDRVPVRFELVDPDYHYHVPVIASPWTYSTYRGNPQSNVS